MASFQASAATSPRANVINSANLSNTSALNFYSSFTSCTSFNFCGHARSMQADPCVHLKPGGGRWRAILPNLHLVTEVPWRSVLRSPPGRLFRAERIVERILGVLQPVPQN